PTPDPTRSLPRSATWRRPPLVSSAAPRSGDVQRRVARPAGDELVLRLRVDARRVHLRGPVRVPLLRPRRHAAVPVDERQLHLHVALLGALDRVRDPHQHLLVVDAALLRLDLGDALLDDLAVVAQLDPVTGGAAEGLAVLGLPAERPLAGPVADRARP